MVCISTEEVYIPVKNIFNKMMQKEGKYTKYLFHKIGRK